MDWFWGKGLLVNIVGSRVESREVSLDPRIYALLSGGRGLAVYAWIMLSGGGRPDPLSPDNPLVIAPGSLVGSGLSTASKTAYVARSPLTGLLGRAIAGGRAGWEIRRLGYDFLAINGAASEPSILVVDSDGARLEPAGELWGETISRARRRLMESYKGYADILIGPAGENRSAIAMIDSGGRQAGRTGLGAVMGAKMIKAVMLKGSLTPRIHDKKRVLEAIKELNAKTHGSPASKNLVEYGTPLMVNYTGRAYGVLPSLNWRESTLSWCPDPEKAYDDLSRFAPKYRVGRNPCIGCGRPCTQVIRVNGSEVDGPEYETVYALGTNIGACRIQDIAHLNKLADDYGFDTISLGATIAWAIHASEEGILDLDIHWGETGKIAELIKDIAYRRGIGDLLADGSRKAAERLGKGKELLVDVKGLEPPAYDARGLKGMALGYAVSSRGADHLTSGAYAFELYGRLWRYEGVDRLSYKGKGRLVRDGEDLMAFYDNTGICKFSRGTLQPENVAPLWSSLTGIPATGGDLLLTGERTINLERLVNLHLGLDPLRDDTLPQRLFKEPIKRGPSKGEVVDEEAFREMRAEYYAARGWTSNGIPLESTLVRLGLHEILPDWLVSYASKTPG